MPQISNPTPDQLAILGNVFSDDEKMKTYQEI